MANTRRDAEERMSSSPPEKSNSDARLGSDDQAAVSGESPRPTDDTPTVISKSPPIVEPATEIQDKFIDLNRKPATPESIVAGLRGRRLAHFELIEPIGVGGMAAVIRARDTQLDRFVALKILPPEMAQEKENVQRFHQEAKAAAKLDHANIARVFYCGEDQGLYFIAFEFVEGMNLRVLMERRGRLPVPESIRYILQIAAGLEHAASRGVVHRDVKPSNIIITPHGQAKLVDMGLARNLERHGEHDLTQSGVTLGTFDYISPEQALEPREADARSDIYSLGCTLYHVLTGQPPVPEGTAAKKLQHHQHHAPIDPRQLNPEIPDEIVMILGKMMAKDPADRYQRPIHLVQHMMQAAQQVGAADDLPEGVLFVDAILPGKPRSRPAVMIGLALAALVVVTLLVSLAPNSNFSGGTNAPTPPGDEKKIPQANADSGHAPGDLTASTPVRFHPVTNDLAELKHLLEDNSSPEINSALSENIDLGSAGLTFQGSSDQTIFLKSEDPEHRTLKFEYTKKGSPVGLTLEGRKQVVFKRIKFVIDSKFTPLRPAAGLAIRDVKHVKFEQCIFIQNVCKITSAPDRTPLASILIDAPENSRPIVDFIGCSFDGNRETGGHVAVAINGPATVNVTDCAFRPHAAFFHFRDKCNNTDTALVIQHCTGFVETGPVFHFSKDASAQVSVDQSLFARLGRGIDGSPGLIYLVGDKPIQYNGRQVRYYNLDSLLQKVKDKQAITKIDKFQEYLKENNNGSSDVNALDLAASPFQLTDPLASSDPLLAFQLKPQYHEQHLGLRTSWAGDMPAPLGPLVKAGKKVIDPDDGRRIPGEFSNVAAALSEAQDGDVIYIKHGESRTVAVPSATLRAGIFVTLKPYEGFRPILVLEKSIEKRESALFEVQKKSRLHFENMEFLLDPEAGYDRCSVVQMGGAAHVKFERCWFALKATNRVELSVVTFPDLDRTMKMDMPSPALSTVDFHECFVRGKGDVVALQGCRKLNVEMTNSLVVLDGSLLDIAAATKTMPMSEGVQWKMDRSSIFTKESLFALHSKTGTVLTETHAKIKDCLLVPLAPDQAVVLLEMSRDVKLSAYLKWDCEHNYYANFEIDKLREWKDHVPEMIMDGADAGPLDGRSNSGKISFPKLTDEARQRLWDATPDMFKPTDPELQRRISGFGLPLESEQRMMQPARPDES
jgi:serine/threonine protein kinase